MTPIEAILVAFALVVLILGLGRVLDNYEGRD
jgi:hypothetical protein